MKPTPEGHAAVAPSTQTRESPVFYVWPAECGVSVISAFGPGRRHFSHPEKKNSSVCECRLCVCGVGPKKEFLVHTH